MLTSPFLPQMMDKKREAEELGLKRDVSLLSGVALIMGTMIGTVVQLLTDTEVRLAPNRINLGLFKGQFSV